MDGTSNCFSYCYQRTERTAVVIIVVLLALANTTRKLNKTKCDALYTKALYTCIIIIVVVIIVIIIILRRRRHRCRHYNKAMIMIQKYYVEGLITFRAKSYFIEDFYYI